MTLSYDVLVRKTDTRFVATEVPMVGSQHALARFAGMWADDETFDEFVSAMDSYRIAVDTDVTQP